MISIDVAGTPYQVPSSAADENWAAKQVAFQQALAAAVNGGAGSGVNVQAYGAVGDGIVDDTDAIIAALEVANGVPAGTWESGGDPYASYDTRPRQVTVFPFTEGGYRVTRSIPIRFRGVGISALQRIGPTEPSEGIRTTIWADHDDDIFGVDALYNVNGFFLRDLFLQKRNAHIGNGHGINVDGANYVFGLGLYNVHIERCDDGFHMVCQGLSDGTGSMADLVFEQTQIANNASYGVNIRGHIAIGSIRNSCSIVANGLGGVKMGVKGFSIENTDFEGQENPIAITNGSASEALVIGPGNYFEGNPVVSTPALIQLGLVNGFRVEGNQFSGNSLAPRVAADTCQNGWIDEPAHIRQCFNVKCRSGVVIPTGGTGTTDMSQTHNADWADAPRAGDAVLPALNERGGGNDYFKAANGRVLAGKLVETPNYRDLINSFTSIPNGDYVFFAFSVKYSVDLPHGSPTVQLLGDIGAGVLVLKTWGLSVDTDAMKVGDTLNFVVGMKNALGATINSASIYVYPYAGDTTPGLGARTSQVMQWIQATAVVPNISPLEMVSGLGTTDPASGDWSAGDRIALLPVANGYAGMVCTASGTSGTWAPFAPIGALGVSGFATAGTLGTVIGKVEIFDEDGGSLGFQPVYDAIT